MGLGCANPGVGFRHSAVAGSLTAHRKRCRRGSIEGSVPLLEIRGNSMFVRRIQLVAVSLALAVLGAAVTGCDPATEPRGADVTKARSVEAEITADEAS